MGLFGRSSNRVDTSPKIADSIATTTCYMCACRCGIKVHTQGRPDPLHRGQRNHPVNRGVLCAKGSAGIMQHYSPARLRKPLLRVGPRGSGEFREIEWEEALPARGDLARRHPPDRSAQARLLHRPRPEPVADRLVGEQFGTPNYAAHGGFCSVNMAAAGLYTIGGSFWEFGEPDWDNTSYFMLFGVAEDHDLQPDQDRPRQAQGRAAPSSSRSIRSAPATPRSPTTGSASGPAPTGCSCFALIHELLHAGRIDVSFLVRYTNAPWLVIAGAGRRR